MTQSTIYPASKRLPFLLALGLLAVGCGKKEDATKDDKSAAAPAPSEGSATAAPGKATASAPTPAKKELPPPPEDVYEGKARVINLGLEDGKPITVDVWATRSFKYAPVKLAENIEFGASSEWFTSPKGSPVKVFPAGASPDSKDDALAGMFHPAKGEHITGVLVNKEDGSFSMGNDWETSDDPEKSGPPDAPPQGKGFVTLEAGQLMAFKSSLAQGPIGDYALQVGNGKGSCYPQRVEEIGYTRSLLGGTQPVYLDLEPGPQTISIHQRMDRDCKDESKLLEFTLEVQADKAQKVEIYSKDGKALEHAVFEQAVNSAKPYGTSKKQKEAKDAERAAKKAAKEAEKAAAGQ